MIRNMRTLCKLLKVLTIEERINFLNNNFYIDDSKSYIGPSQILGNAMLWSNTIEGHDYWSNIAVRLA